MILLLNIIKVAMDPSQIPVEFSTVTYFIAPIIILLRIKKMEVWAVYASLMAGFFYYLTMMVAGGKVYELYPPLNVYASLLSHGSLLLIGLLKLRTVKYQSKYSYFIIIGLFAHLAWALYSRPEISITSRIFIYEIIDASFVTGILPAYSFAMRIGVYLLLSYALLKSIKLIFAFNEFGLKRQSYFILKSETRNRQRSRETASLFSLNLGCIMVE